MMGRPLKITVTSGQGETGKTSLIAAFATMGDRRVLADCDVDAAALHLVLNPEVIREEIFIGGTVWKSVEGTLNGACSWGAGLKTVFH